MSLARTLALLAALVTMSLTAAPALADHRDNHQPGRGNGRGPHVQDDSNRGRANQAHDVVRGRALHGEIERISGTIWTIERDGRGGEVRVDVDGATVKWPGRKDATIADFRVGHTVNVKLERSDNGRGSGRGVSTTSILKARAVHFVPAHGRDRERFEGERFNGTVTAVSSTSLTVNNPDRGSRTFILSDQTQVRLGRLAGVISDIRVGDRVSVLTREGETLARIVSIRAELERFNGTVTAVSSTSLTVNNPDRGARTFTLSSRTIVRAGRDPAVIADIRLGDRVTVVTRQGDTLALQVTIRD